ncbi:hypothetical protein [Zavarzinella formosa]|uniref:hypothetical protein n=1 Tax=Zavarzinella formosa TaxID=360055 RepID=UPI000312E3FA|nr:hypothetical protein [Zavarzinella formosa]
MYDIVTLEPEDKVVMAAVNAIIAGNGAIPGPNGNYRFIAPGGTKVAGDGGAKNAVLVVVAHGSPDTLSSCKTWPLYKSDVTEAVDWAGKTTVFLAACSTAGTDGGKFLHGNIANQVKADFPKATVWASDCDVTAGTQAGNWHKL